MLVNWQLEQRGDGGGGGEGSRRGGGQGETEAGAEAVGGRQEKKEKQE